MTPLLQFLLEHRVAAVIIAFFVVSLIALVHGVVTAKDSAPTYDDLLNKH